MLDKALKPHVTNIKALTAKTVRVLPGLSVAEVPPTAEDCTTDVVLKSPADDAVHDTLWQYRDRA